MKCIFRCNIGTERSNTQKKYAQGIGHLAHCLSIARELSRKTNSDLIFVIEGDEDVSDYLDKQNITYYLNQDETKLYSSLHPSLIFVDINYLDPELVSWYRQWGPVINLAPRGAVKYFADMTFNDTEAFDIPFRKGMISRKLFCGPEFAIINEEFIRLRNELEERIYNEDSGVRVVVSMGGVDKFDITRIALNYLIRCMQLGIHVTVILGPFYPFTKEIIDMYGSYEPQVKIVQYPQNFPEIIADSQLGISVDLIDKLCGLRIRKKITKGSLVEFFHLE